MRRPWRCFRPAGPPRDEPCPARGWGTKIESPVLTAVTRFLRRLGVRLVLFLTLALVPVGLIGVIQTSEVVERAQEQAQALLADRTRNAAKSERDVIMGMMGAARGLGEMALALGFENPSCGAHMAAFVARNAPVLTAGVVRQDGQTMCTSNGVQVNVNGRAVWSKLLADIGEQVYLDPHAPVSGQPVIVAVSPIMSRGHFAGYVFVSVPHRLVDHAAQGVNGAEFKTFNSRGEVLTSSDEKGNDKLLPRDMELSSLAVDNEMTFTGMARDGDKRVFSVSPIVDGAVYVIGSWPLPSVDEGRMGGLVPPAAFPIIMWLLSLIVAYAAVDRLVLRHIRILRRQMAGFAGRRELPAPVRGGFGSSREIADIYETLRDTMETILQDEASLEQLLHDKNVLLKEVHHRVKNNLQLISSIMNMQMRKLHSRESKTVLKRLQNRVLSLATIHKTLYRTDNLSRVEAPVLLDELVNQLAAMATDQGDRIAMETAFEAISLYPDQAVPLSLLLTEAVTNALKYVGSAEGGRPRIRVSLAWVHEGRAELRVENSKGPMHPHGAAETVEGTGLGSGLIRAFAMQLHGELEVTEDETAYVLHCAFPVAGFVAPEDEDD